MKISTLILSSSILALTVGCASNSDQQATISKEQQSPDAAELMSANQGVVTQLPMLEDVLYEQEADVSALPAPGQFKKSEHKSLRIAADSTHAFAAIAPATQQTKGTFFDHSPNYYQDHGREKYAFLEQNPVKQVISEPVSTFSIDVDTASYTNVRRFLNQGALPPSDAVRIEEMINYFQYNYAAPSDPSMPFSINTELASSPWSENHVLLKVGLQGFEPPKADRPASNLVFLLDVSGSMNSPDKLPLLKKSLVLLSKQLGEDDSVAIVVYAGASGVVLEPTKGNQTHKIEDALGRLAAGGSTNGEAGIELAYKLAQSNYIEGGINRVILATDGDFNVGTSDIESLKNLIETKRKEGVSLTTLGFGTGNYNDHLMETLADHGNGNYAYIDSFKEAKKVLAEQLDATLMTIAKDVKIQIEFNPGIVKEYRLLGYENRSLNREDFNNDLVDAGEIGAGHSVTAIYELALQSSEYSTVDPLRYQLEQADGREHKYGNELAFVKFRYKAPEGDKSKLISKPVLLSGQIGEFDEASESFRFSATVAQFGEALRQSKYVTTDYKVMIDHALKARGEDPMGYRSEFIQLVRLAANLSNS